MDGSFNVFLTDSSNATKRDNRIGVAAASDGPLGNGVSRIYVGTNNSALLEHNVIAYSGDFGVAIARFSAAQILSEFGPCMRMKSRFRAPAVDCGYQNGGNASNVAALV
ncbi:MAG TPA: hypothetical protein VNN08_08790 [Thermoanaerobaculia bacterium]|nr:hypothetical protein [Thermoanaerobaculia bacterium]